MVNGLPLLGDKLYLGYFEMFQRFKDNIASKEDHDLMDLNRHALHAMAIQVPYKSERKIFSSHIPKDLREWISRNLTVEIESIEEKLKHHISDYFIKETK